MKKRVPAYILFFVLPGLSLIWFFMPFARMNHEILEYRGLFPPVRTYQLSDVQTLEFDHDEASGANYDQTHSYVTLHFVQGQKVRFEVDSVSMAKLIIFSKPHVICEGTSGFKYEKKFIIKGSTMQQRVGRILKKAINKYNIRIPEECRWILLS